VASGRGVLNAHSHTFAAPLLPAHHCPPATVDVGVASLGCWASAQRGLVSRAAEHGCGGGGDHGGAHGEGGGALARALREAEGPEQARAVLQAEWERGRLNPEQLSALIVELGMAESEPGEPGMQRLGWVWGWAREQQGVLAVTHYTSYIVQLARSRPYHEVVPWRDAEAVFGEMARGGLTPDVATYNALIGAYAEGEQWEAAEAAFEAMGAAGVARTVETYNALIAAYGGGKQTARAEAVIRKEMPAAGFTPTLETHVAMLNAYGTGRHGRAAERAFRTMAQTETPDVLAYNALIRAHWKSRQWEEAEAAFERMTAAGVKPNVDTWTYRIRAYGICRQPAKAAAAFDEMLAAGSTPDVYTHHALVSAYAKDGRWEAAGAAFHGMAAAGIAPTGNTYSALIHAYSKGSQCRAAEEAFEAMRAAGMTLDEFSFNPLVDVLWRCGEPRRALDLYREAVEAGVYAQPDPTAGKLDLHRMSAGVALASLTLWLDATAAACWLPSRLPDSFLVVTGWGKNSVEVGKSPVKDGVTGFLESHNSPFEPTNQGSLQASRADVCRWLESVAPLVQRV
jgi:pentatricopeptide repeat protein